MILDSSGYLWIALKIEVHSWMALNSSRNGSWKLLLMYLGTTADAVDLLYLYYVLFRATKNSSTLIGLLGISLAALVIALD